MYQYDEFDRSFIQERVAQYRDQTDRYLNGEIPDDVFQQLRLRNGLYIQRLAPMLRIAVPYGTLSSSQLRKLAQISKEYDKGYGHLTTRQNVQLNWPELEEVPDILRDLAEVDMHAIQTSGSCIRNVTTDEFAGVAADEEVDARPYCELLRQWSTYHPEFEWLPRKFKIALNGSKSDRAAIAVHDIGIQLRKNQETGTVSFDIYVGGGLGRTPVIGSLIREGLGEEHLLTYVEAVLRIYNRYGRRDNKYKARIKILVKAMTPEVFRDKVDEEWQHIKDSPQELTEEELQRVKHYFDPPVYDQIENETFLLAKQRLSDVEFNRWVDNNVSPHKQRGYAVVTLSTKVPGVPPGDVTAEQMNAVAGWAEDYGFGEVRISHEQNFILPDVRQEDLLELFKQARDALLGNTNAGKLTDMICCPGGDYCSLANAKSIPVADEIQRTFDDVDYLYDLGPLDLNISGCMNACGHHHVGHIGILGVDKRGKEYYQISIGGHAGNDSSLGKIIGPSFSRSEVVPTVQNILDTYLDLRLHGESFLETYRRIGIEPFKENVYDEDVEVHAVAS
ncbi:MAG: nitrite/sulfite reductase [Gammaproteobacteria bacterium]|nr:nitrite/sulfite reductase [Gammaproteobacteria bacterium]